MPGPIGPTGPPGASGSQVPVTPTPPASPTDGEVYFDPNAGQLYIAVGGVWHPTSNLSGYLPLSGGTINPGPLSFNQTVPDLTVPNVSNAIYGQKNGVNRWLMKLGDQTNETTTPTGTQGSIFSLSAYNNNNTTVYADLFKLLRSGSAYIQGGYLQINDYVNQNGTASIAGFVKGSGTVPAMWYMYLGASAPTGTNNGGGDFELRGYLDNGSTFTKALRMLRADGTAIFGGNVVIAPSATGSLSFQYPYGTQIAQIGVNWSAGFLEFRDNQLNTVFSYDFYYGTKQTKFAGPVILGQDATAALGAVTLQQMQAAIPGAYVLPPASTTVLGGVKVDGTTITATAAGVITAVGGGSGGGGTITAGSTPTSGFTAGQFVMSDGSFAQPAVVSASGNTIIISPAANSGYGLANFNASGNYTGLCIGGVNPLGMNGYIGWSPNGYPATGPDIAFTRDGAGIVAAKRISGPTNPVAIRAFNTFTDLNNGEWGAFDWMTTANTLTIGAQANGSGVLRQVNIVGNSVFVPSGLQVSGYGLVIGAGGMSVTGGGAIHGNVTFNDGVILPSAPQANPGGSQVWSNNGVLTLGAASAPALPAGVTDGSNAAAGQIGEVVSTIITTPVNWGSTGAVFLVGTLPTLTAGDWDVQGEVWFAISSGTPTAIDAGINTANNALPSAPALGASRWSLALSFSTSKTLVASLSPCRVNVASSTPLYLVASVAFTSSAGTATGKIWARRRR